MPRPIAVLRPEPGNRVTAAAIEARGRTAIRLPLFEVHPVDWEAPDARDFDALVLTSANAVRHGGSGLDRLRSLPVYAVGEVTAEAARRAGFDIALIGADGAAGLVTEAEAAGVRRALHVAGRERTIEAGGSIVRVVTVYASELRDVPSDTLARLEGCIALVQSARAGARLAELVEPAMRATIALVAIGTAAAQAAGHGWERVVVPRDFRGTALIDAAVALAD